MNDEKDTLNAGEGQPTPSVPTSKNARRWANGALLMWGLHWLASVHVPLFMWRGFTHATAYLLLGIAALIALGRSAYLDGKEFTHFAKFGMAIVLVSWGATFLRNAEELSVAYLLLLLNWLR